MIELLCQLLDGLNLTGDIGHDVPAFLNHHGRPKTAVHSAAVAAEARRIAGMVSVPGSLAELGGWLHDVSAVFPPAERLTAAKALGIELLPEEEAFPLIIHQKLSVVLARELFGVVDPGVLSAIGCHTTLRANATNLDKVVFIADKIAWDQPGVPPYREELLTALDRSLDEAAFFFLRYLWERRDTLKALHPWLREAYEQLYALRKAGDQPERKRS